MLHYHLQLAFHNIRRNPWLTLMTVLAIGVGIGSSMSVYTVLHMLSRDPAPELTHRLHTVRIDNWGPEFWRTFPDSPKVRRFGHLPLTLTYRDAVTLRNARAAPRQTLMTSVSVTLADGEGHRVQPGIGGLAVDADFFRMFGVALVNGTEWDAEADAAGARVVVVNERIAATYFPGVDPVGRLLQVNGHDLRVVGVARRWYPQPLFHMPLGFGVGGSIQDANWREDEVFLPFATWAALYRSGTDAPGSRAPFPSETWHCPYAGPARDREEWFRGECTWVRFWAELPTRSDVARLRGFLDAHVAAQQQIGRFDWLPATRLERASDRIEAGWYVTDDYRIAPLAGFGFFLVCLVNAAALILARLHVRRRELSLRRALGASRNTLLAQCLVEVALIGGAGAVLGLLLLALGTAMNRMLLPPALHVLAEVDWSVLVLTVAVALAGALCAGLLPAWSATRSPGIGDGAGFPRRRFGAVLIAVQVTLTLSIAANALYLAWQHVQVVSEEAGLDGGNIFVVSSQWSTSPVDLKARNDRDLAALRSLPGVVAVSQSSGPPGIGQGAGPYAVHLEPPDPDSPPLAMAHMYFVDEHAPEAFGIRPESGWWFSAAEVGFGAPAIEAVVVSSDLAKRLFPDGNAVGQRVYIANGRPVTIIGVMPTVAEASLGPSRKLTYFVGMRGYGFADGLTQYVVRTLPGQRDVVMRRAEALLAGIDPTRALPSGLAGQRLGAVSYQGLRAIAFRDQRNLAIMLLTVCGLLLLTMALGIVGLTNYWMSRQRHLIGVRRALGATRGHILRAVHAGTFAIVAIGVLAGSAIAFAVGLWAARAFQIPPVPPSAVFAGALLVVLLSQLAVLLPARRAAGIPPAVASRPG